MRLFIAIRLSDAIRDSLIQMQNALYDRGVRGNYTPEENLHLTLAFIGEYPDAQPVLDALSSVPFRPFELGLEGMGRFGDLWWAGMRESVPLQAAVRRIRRALAESGIPFDKKRFRAHITLIRKASGDLPGGGCGITGKEYFVDPERLTKYSFFGRVTLDPEAFFLRYNAVVIQKNDERKRRK